MVFEINGVSFVDMIAHGGFKWQRADVDGSNTGRSIDNGYLYRDRISTKVRLDITCRPLKTAEISKVLKAIYPEYVTVRYTDPQQGGVVVKEMYSNNIPASYVLKKGDEEYWSGVTFPLIER